MKWILYILLFIISTSNSIAQKRYTILEFGGDVQINYNPLRNLSEITKEDKITLYKDSYIRIRRKEKSSGGKTISYHNFEQVAERDGKKHGAKCYTMSYHHFLDVSSNTSQENKQEDSNNTLGARSYNKSIKYSFVNDGEVNTSYNEKRIALVVGNSDYQDSTWQEIPICRQSAFSIAEKLRSIGFHTIVISNANHDRFYDVLHDFMNRDAKDSVMIKLFCYVGHGMRINGYDYIVPIDAGKNDTKKSIKNDTIAQVLGQSMSANYNLLFFDACRDTLFGKLDAKVYDEHIIGNKTCIVYSTQKDDYAIGKKDDETITPFSRAFINATGHQNFKIDNILKRLSKEVYKKIKKNIDWKPANLMNFETIRLNKEKTMCWLGGGGTYQMPFKNEMPISFAPNLCFAVDNIYLWRYKTQFEIEFGWNVLNKKTSPVYLYDDGGIKCAPEFKNTWNASFRYGPNIYLCRNMSFSPMVGISYHHLEGYDKIGTDDISSDCTTLTLDVELSYKFHRRWKVNLTLETNVYRPPFLYTGYHTLKDVSFMEDWYGSFKNVNVGVGITYRITK